MIDPERLRAEPLRRVEQTIGWRDCILCALGLGVGLDPLGKTRLPFVDERRLKVEPTMANVAGYPGFWMREARFVLDFEKTVHDEHAMRLNCPLPSEARVIGTSRLTGLVDEGAGKGTLIYRRHGDADPLHSDPEAAPRRLPATDPGRRSTDTTAGFYGTNGVLAALFAAGRIPSIGPNLPLLEGGSLVGGFWGAFKRNQPQRNEADLPELLRLSRPSGSNRTSAHQRTLPARTRRRDDARPDRAQGAGQGRPDDRAMTP